MPLTRTQKSHLRGLAHALKPVVMVGHKGVTEGVMGELEQALNHHELIKVKLTGDRDERDQIMQRILALTGAESVQQIGRMVVLYRRNPEQQVVTLANSS